MTLEECAIVEAYTGYAMLTGKRVQTIYTNLNMKNAIPPNLISVVSVGIDH